MRTLNVTLEDEDFEELKKKKDRYTEKLRREGKLSKRRGFSWAEYLLKNTN